MIYLHSQTHTYTDMYYGIENTLKTLNTLMCTSWHKANNLMSLVCLGNLLESFTSWYCYHCIKGTIGRHMTIWLISYHLMNLTPVIEWFLYHIWRTQARVHDNDNDVGGLHSSLHCKVDHMEERQRWWDHGGGAEVMGQEVIRALPGLRWSRTYTNSVGSDPNFCK